MAIIPRPDVLYLGEAVQTNTVWGFSPKAEEQPQVYIDEMMSALFTPPEHSFNHPEMREDLELDTLVDKAFEPNYSKEFVRKVFSSAPTKRDVILDRQKTLEILFQNADERKRIGDVAQSLNGIIKTLLDIDKQKRLRDFAYTGGLLAAEVTLLSGYVDMIHSLGELPELSQALRQLREFGRTIKTSEDFQELEQYSTAFRNRYTFTLEVAVDPVGAVTGLNIVSINTSGSFTRNGFLPNLRGRRVLQKLRVDNYEIVAQAIDKIVNKNLKQISEASFLLGPLDFYLSALRFYDQMEAKGVTLTLPEIIDMKERATFIPGVRNPLLLYKKGEKRIEKGNDIVPNDISYDAQKRVRIISGPNSGGKTVYLKAVGIATVLAQNGMRIPAQVDGQPCKISAVDELYTVFVSREETTADAGGQLEYQAKQVLKVLKRLTQYSLVLFDEIGRGTSEDEGTDFCFDNIVHPLALSSEGPIGSAAYFSTHLHHFAERADSLEGVENYQAEIVKKDTGQLTPTYRMISGMAGKSYAKLVEGRVGLGKDNVDGLIRQRRERGTL